MIAPKIPKKKPSLAMRTCPRCKQILEEDDFACTHSFFFPDGRLPVCNDCITNFLKEHMFDWKFVDKICQWADIPFIPKEWERLRELNSEETVWASYAKVFAVDDYKSLGWDDYFHQYQKLKEAGLIEDEIPIVREERYRELRRSWGANYDDDQLNYLEDLYKGLLLSQNVNGALQIDQARKLCKLSLEIDARIRAGDKDVDKFMSSYDKMVKTAEFTPKNAKNAVDFDSVGELALWLEKRGHQNKFYDNVTRDVVDETLKNIENWNQRLYINESGIGEEVSARIAALKNVQEIENIYGTQKDFDSDEYTNDALKFEDEEEGFEA